MPKASNTNARNEWLSRLRRKARTRELRELLQPNKFMSGLHNPERDSLHLSNPYAELAAAQEFPIVDRQLPNWTDLSLPPP